MWEQHIERSERRSVRKKKISNQTKNSRWCSKREVKHLSHFFGHSDHIFVPDRSALRSFNMLFAHANGATYPRIRPLGQKMTPWQLFEVVVSQPVKDPRVESVWSNELEIKV